MRALLLTIALLAASTALAPTASADTCASTIAENTVCTPVYAFYCALYAGPKYLAQCEAYVVTNCVANCPRDLDGIIVLS